MYLKITNFIEAAGRVGAGGQPGRIADLSGEAPAPMGLASTLIRAPEAAGPGAPPRCGSCGDAAPHTIYSIYWPPSSGAWIYRSARQNGPLSRFVRVSSIIR